MQTKRPVGRPRKIKEESLKDYIDSIAVPAYLKTRKPLNTKDEIQDLKNEIEMLKFVVVELARAIEDGSWQGVLYETRRLLKMD